MYVNQDFESSRPGSLGKCRMTALQTEGAVIEG
jgi:hypothetical protein